MAINHLLSSALNHTLSAVIRSGSGGGSSPVGALDYVMPSTLQSKTVHLWSPHRAAEWWDQPTVRLKRLSDNAQADFTPNGILFDGAATTTGGATVETWRAGADVDVVCQYDQVGSGKPANANGVVAFIRSNVYLRLGSDYTQSTEALTRSTTNGAIAPNLAGTGYLRVSGSNIAPSSAGVRAFMLYAHNNELRGDGLRGDDTVTALPAIGSEESILCIGKNTNAYVRYRWDPSVTGKARSLVVATNNTNSQTANDGNDTWLKQYSQRLADVQINSSNVNFNEFYAPSAVLTMNSANTTAIAGGTLDGSDILIGNVFVDTAGTVKATNYGNFLFGGLIVCTDAITALEAYQIQSRLALLGQAHMALNLSDLQALPEETVVMKDMDATTGVVAGRNGKTTITANLPTGTNTSAPAYTTSATSKPDTPSPGTVYNPTQTKVNDPLTGLPALYSNNGYNLANAFTANNNYFSNVQKGTIVSFCVPNKYTDLLPAGRTYTDGQGVVRTIPGVSEGLLEYSVGTALASHYLTNDRSVAGIMFGKDHGTWADRIQIQASIDIYGVLGTRRCYPVTELNTTYLSRHWANYGDAAGQQNTVKYNTCIPLSKIESANRQMGNGTTTVNVPGVGIVIEPSVNLNTLKNQGNVNLYFDEIVLPLTGTNQSFAYNFDQPIVRMMSFEPPSDWDYNGGYAGNYQKLLKGKVCVAAGVVGAPIGTVIADYGVSLHAPVRIPDPNEKIMSVAWFGSFQGKRFLFLFFPRVLSFAEMQKVQMNLYKFFDDTIGQANAAPVNTSAPTITGSAIEAGRLIINRGVWTGVPTPTYTYQGYEYASQPTTLSQLQAGTPITGATGSTYVNPTDVPALPQNKWRAWKITASNGVGSPVEAWTAAVEIIQIAAPVRTSNPSLGGFVNVAQTVTITPGTYTGPNLTTARGHYIDGTLVGTGLTYTFAAGDQGKSYQWIEVTSNTKGSVTYTSSAVTVGAARAYNLLSTIKSGIVLETRANVLDAFDPTTSATLLKNIETAPADGSAQSDWDLLLGASWVLNGTAGNKAAYLVPGGASALTINKALITDMPTLARCLHRTGTNAKNWWWGCFFRIGTHTADQELLSTKSASSTTIGLRSYMNSARTQIVTQRGDTSSSTLNQTLTVGNGDDRFFFEAFSRTNNQKTTWNKSYTGVTNSQNFNSTDADPTQLLKFFTNLQNTGRVYDIVLGIGAAPTNAEIQAMVEFMQTEDLRAYI